MPLADLERFLGIAAYIVVRHGDAFAPVFERLEREVDQERARQGKRDRAQGVLSQLMRKGVSHAPAA